MNGFNKLIKCVLALMVAAAPNAAAQSTGEVSGRVVSSSGNEPVSADLFGVAAQTSASGFTLEGEERKNAGSVLADDPLRAVQGLPGVSSNNDFSSEFLDSRSAFQPRRFVRE